jgi:hypothetical protein
MFNSRYFATRYYPERYFPKVGSSAVVLYPPYYFPNRYFAKVYFAGRYYPPPGDGIITPPEPIDGNVFYGDNIQLQPWAMPDRDRMRRKREDEEIIIL